MLPYVNDLMSVFDLKPIGCEDLNKVLNDRIFQTYMERIKSGGNLEMNDVQILATFLAGSMWQRRTGGMT